MLLLKISKLNMKFLLISLLVSFVTTSLLGQTSTFKRDTVYVFICYGTLNNGRPVATTIQFKKNCTSLNIVSQFLIRILLCANFLDIQYLFIDPIFTLQ